MKHAVAPTRADNPIAFALNALQPRGILRALRGPLCDHMIAPIRVVRVVDAEITAPAPEEEAAAREQRRRLRDAIETAAGRLVVVSTDGHAPCGCARLAVSAKHSSPYKERLARERAERAARPRRAASR